MRLIAVLGGLPRVAQPMLAGSGLGAGRHALRSRKNCAKTPLIFFLTFVDYFSHASGSRRGVTFS
ncbi:MAG: hypothetical protein QOD56_2521 [Gammaproteobacteria bacterium]|jgi:hypothetical protein|nr:hypothetical protein [Gammaproteobacteria bacterium]